MDLVMESYLSRGVAKAHRTDFNVRNFRQMDGARWFGAQDWNGYENALRQKELEEPGFLLECGKEYESRLNECREFADELAELDFSNESNEGLKKTFQEFLELNKSFFGYAYTYIVLNKFYPDELTRVVSEKVRDLHAQTKALELLCALDKPSETRMEKKELLELALKIKNGLDLESGLAQEWVQEHLRKYAHLGLYYFYRRPYDSEAIKQRLRELIATKDLETKLQELVKQEENAEKTRQLLRELEFAPQHVLLVETIKQFAFVANYFDETYNYAVCRMLPFLNAVASRLGIGFEQLVEMRATEIICSLEKDFVSKEFAQELMERRKDNALVLENGAVRVLTGKELQRYRALEQREETLLEQTRELKGVSASPGTARGRVVVLNSAEEIHKVRKGDVLVAAATYPALVPAMERACAIVTNEGGLLCHAAIVSRELGIPCVVGTKIATRALKDGDTVEVDAGKGVVKKLG
jgi:phosphohistidine swiveling domain-containing protein